jgi:hypothetical protein
MYNLTIVFKDYHTVIFKFGFLNMHRRNDPYHACSYAGMIYCRQMILQLSVSSLLVLLLPLLNIWHMNAASMFL